MDLRAGSISKSLGPSRSQSLLVTLGWSPPQLPTQGKLRWPFFFLFSSFKKNYTCTKKQKPKPTKILLPRPQNTEHTTPVPTKQGTLGCKAFSSLLPALFKSPLDWLQQQAHSPWPWGTALPSVESGKCWSEERAFGVVSPPKTTAYQVGNTSPHHRTRDGAQDLTQLGKLSITH